MTFSFTRVCDIVHTHIYMYMYMYIYMYMYMYIYITCIGKDSYDTVHQLVW